MKSASLKMLLILLIVGACSKSISQETPPVITKPSPPTIFSKFASKDVNGREYYCATSLQYKVAVISFDSYKEQCEACPGWINGESNNN